MKLKTKFTLILSLFVVTILALIAFLILSHYKKSIKETIAQQQFLMIGSLADEIDSKLLTAQQVLIAASKLTPPDIMQNPEKAQALLDNRPGVHAVFDNYLFLFTPSGKLFVQSPTVPGRRGLDFSFREYMINTLKTKKPYISDPYASSLPNKHPVIMFTVPLFDGKGKIRGILAGSIDLMRENFLGRIGTVKIGEKGYLFLTTADRTVIMHPDKKRILTKVSPGVNGLYDKAIDGFEGTGETINSYGIKMIYSFKRVKATNWLLGASYPSAEAYRPIRDAERFLLIASVTGIIAIFFIISYIIKYLIKPVELLTRHIEELPQKTGDNRFLNIKTKDEIGTLSAAFNKMETESKLSDELIQIRLRLLEFALEHNLEELLRKTLDEVGKLVDSPIGFYHLVERDQETLSLQAWSALTLEKFCKAEGKGLHYPTEKAGVWVDCVHQRKAVIHNDYASLPHRKGMPEGHAHVTRELVVPIFRNDRIVAILGVGNKPQDYTEQDVKIVAYFADVAWEITQHKRAEEALRKSEEKFRNLFNNAEVGMFRSKLDGSEVLDVNSKFLDIVGLTIEDTLGKSSVNLWADPKEREEMVKRLVSDGSVTAFEYRMLNNRQGEIRNCLTSVKLYKEQGILEGSIIDITERIRAEDALRESKEKISQILNSTAEGIYGLDHAGNCTFCNPSSIKLLGYHDDKDLIGKNMHELIHHAKADGTSYPKEECELRRANLKGEFIHRDREILWRSDGKSFPAEFWAHPIFKDNELIGTVVTFIDISDRVAIESQLQQAQKMEAIGTLAGGVAHDFNNILSAIMGFGTMAKNRIKDDEKARHFIEEILASTDRAAELTHSLLAFSRKQTISLKQVDLNNIIRNLNKMLVRVIGEDIKLNNLLINRELTVMADRGQIEQVLMNLVTNARDAMSDGGELTIQTGAFDVDSSYAEAHHFENTGTYAVLTVSDTGMGMDKRTRENIFEPFFTTKEVGKGTGLGLAMVYGIVKQHGGDINVYSEPGRGTTFKIYLPMITNIAEEKSEVVQLIPSGRGETILLVEDNPDVRMATGLCLQQFGYKVIEAENGEEAIKRFIENRDKIALVLLDVIMPVKNGRYAYEEIKKLSPDMKVIFMSGYTDDIISGKGILEEGFDFISKPINPGTLIRKIREVLDR